jgi:hypothetical protein
MPFDGTYQVSLPKSEAMSGPRSTWYALRSAVAALLAPARAFGLLPAVPADPGIPPELGALHLLRSARALIELEDRWVQGRYKTARGRRCAVGALQAATAFVTDPRAFQQAKELLREEALRRGYSHIETMNDETSHGVVMAAFDSAIVRAEVRLAA